MSQYRINPEKAANQISSSVIKPLFNKDFSVATKLTSSRYSYQRSIASDIKEPINNTSETSNNIAKNVRLTLTPQAIRQNKFDIFSGLFAQGFPANDNYLLCPQRLSTVFNYSGAQFTSFRIFNLPAFPTAQTVGLVKNLIIGLDCGENNCYYDPASGECASSPPVCIPTPPTQITIPPNLKTTIKGYAFYLDSIREVNIPSVGDMLVACAGGHYCCRTDFTPRIFTTEGVYAGNSFSMNNLPNCPTSNNEVVGFVPASQFEKSAYFTIDIPNINDEINTALFGLNCDTPEGCHNGVTMVFLVAEDAVTNESYVIFASCVAVGCTSPVPVGTITPTDDPPVLCEPEDPETPVLDCNDVRVVTLSCSLSKQNLDPSDLGTREIIDYINLIINTEQIISGEFDSTSTFNATQELPPVILPSVPSIPVSVIIGVTRTPVFTAVYYNFFSSTFINGSQQIFSLEFNVPTTSINPYERVSSEPSVGGWLVTAYDTNLLENCESIELVLNN
jgi:hypothetical protein